MRDSGSGFDDKTSSFLNFMLGFTALIATVFVISTFEIEVSKAMLG